MRFLCKIFPPLNLMCPQGIFNIITIQNLYILHIIFYPLPFLQYNFRRCFTKSPLSWTPAGQLHPQLDRETMNMLLQYSSLPLHSGIRRSVE